MKYLKKITFCSLILSLFFHLFIMYEGYSRLYHLIINPSLTPSEKNQVQENKSKIEELKREIPAPKELVKSVKESKERIDAIMKEFLTNSQSVDKKKLDDLRIEREEYQKGTESLAGYSKYREEDLKILKDQLSKKTDSIINEAIKRESKNKGNSENFKDFLDKGGESAKIEPNEFNVSVLSGEDLKRLKSKPQPKKNCDDSNSFYGIGVSFDVGDSSKEHFLSEGQWKINKIGKGYGADSAGIKLGDVILGSFDTDGKFMEGISFIRDNLKFKEKKLKILLNRDGKGFEKEVLISKICYEKF